jgi:RNA polymerase sigma factor FliA
LSLTDITQEAADLPARELDPEAQLLKKQSAQRFRQIIDKLPVQEREIIEDYYFRNKSFHQIAEELGGVSKSWISRLHARAIERIKKRYFEDQA